MEKIKPKEREKYELIDQELQNLMFYRIEDQGTYLIKLDDKISAKTDIERKDIILINENKKEFSLKTLLPKRYKFEFLKHSWTVDKKKKIVVVPVILSELYLLICLHEIGHAWDYDMHKEHKTIEESWEEGKDLAYKVRQDVEKERNAWAWALKKFLILRRQNFISQNITKQKLMDIAKGSMYTYARHNHRLGVDEYKKFLNKEL